MHLRQKTHWRLFYINKDFKCLYVRNDLSDLAEISKEGAGEDNVSIFRTIFLYTQHIRNGTQKTNVTNVRDESTDT